MGGTYLGRMPLSSSRQIPDEVRSASVTPLSNVKEYLGNQKHSE